MDMVKVYLSEEEISALKEFLSSDLLNKVTTGYTDGCLTVDEDTTEDFHEACVDRTLQLGFDEDNGGEPRGNGRQIELIQDKIFDASENA